MEFEKFKVNGLLLIKPKIFSDDRGFFFESFHKAKFFEMGIDIEIFQQNQSGSKKNILRGLHYQIKNSQGKLVRVLRGQVFDVAVDLRKTSPTFGKWESVVLSEENKDELWIPPGFAHGFYVLSDWAEVEYFTTNIYSPEYERTIIWNDPDLGINWPIPDGEQPILSEKDSQGKLYKDAEIYE
ncbi:MAG: dTDP-4-dehydrorhamnose 3,5-epimerase [Lutibacter sp.]